WTRLWIRPGKRRSAILSARHARAFPEQDRKARRARAPLVRRSKAEGMRKRCFSFRGYRIEGALRASGASAAPQARQTAQRHDRAPKPDERGKRIVISAHDETPAAPLISQSEIEIRYAGRSDGGFCRFLLLGGIDALGRCQRCNGAVAVADVNIGANGGIVRTIGAFDAAHRQSVRPYLRRFSGTEQGKRFGTPQRRTRNAHERHTEARMGERYGKTRRSSDRALNEVE